MSPFCQFTSLDQGGGSEEDVTADQTGSPDRLVQCDVRGCCVVVEVWQEER